MGTGCRCLGGTFERGCSGGEYRGGLRESEHHVVEIGLSGFEVASGDHGRRVSEDSLRADQITVRRVVYGADKSFS